MLSVGSTPASAQVALVTDSVVTDQTPWSGNPPVFPTPQYTVPAGVSQAMLVVVTQTESNETTGMEFDGGTRDGTTMDLSAEYTDGTRRIKIYTLPVNPGDAGTITPSVGGPLSLHINAFTVDNAGEVTDLGDHDGPASGSVTFTGLLSGNLNIGAAMQNDGSNPGLSTDGELLSQTSGGAGSWSSVVGATSTASSLTLTNASGSTPIIATGISIASSTIPPGTPSANAGPDQEITLPQNTVTLNGSGTDDDGTIVSYEWSQISGPDQVTLSGTDTATLIASDLVAGDYVFRLIVTDNESKEGGDSVVVTVLPEAAGTGAFVETDGLVVMDVESMDVVSPWSEENSIPGFLGDGYFVGTVNRFSNPGFGTISYPFTVTTSGRYQLNWRSRIAQGTNNTEHNDSWARLTDANGNVLTPEENNLSPSADGWLKVYMNTRNAWHWQASNRDNNPRAMFWDLEAGTTYQLQISQRSAGHAVDRLLLWDHNRHNLANTNTGRASDTATLDALPLSPRSSDASGPTDPVELVFDALNDLPAIDAGAVPYYRDNSRNALAIDASNTAHRNVFARAELTFPGEAGNYDVTIDTIGEEDGESTYRLLVNGVVVGTVTNTPTTAAFEDQQHVFANVTIPTGATIGIESNAVTNGLIPEGDGTAYSRGRWTQLSFAVSGGDPAPVALAGPDQIVELPAGATLDGSASSDDSAIDTYAWEQVSGPNTATIDDASLAAPSVSGLVQGTYVYRLTVTDDAGQTATDEVSVFAITPGASTAIVSGETKKWHKVTLSFFGPQTSETANPNPFTDYRLDVTFTHDLSGKSYTVPGYYAADGDAEDTGATGGNIWRVHFSPDETGVWNYAASFRTGTDVATSEAASPGSSAGFFDGDNGTIVISPTDKAGRDFRGKGRLEYIGEHYLRFAETGEYFLKQGPDAPENFLAYADFDGPFKTDGQYNRNTFDNEAQSIKEWAAHLNDWQEGDPLWQQTDGNTGAQGRAIIGALNYLVSEGLNAFSFLTMNINGDDKNVFPYLNYNERERLDVSRLAQWEVVFEHAQRNGLFLHFKTQETENDRLLDGGDLGPQRKLYYRELIARFGHHLALNWNFGEENDIWNSLNDPDQTRIKAYAEYFDTVDPYGHHRVIHTYPGQKQQVYGPLLGDASKMTGASLQTSNGKFNEVHNNTLTWVQNSANAGKPWAVAVDEPGNATDGLIPDSDDDGTTGPTGNHTSGRKDALWGTLMAGGWGNEWYFGYQHAHSDLTCEDFRSRDQWWDYCRYALEFFDISGVPFWEMTNDNAKTNANDDYVFYKSDEAYIVYLKNGGTPNLDLSDATGEFAVQWYDPRNGGSLKPGSIATVSGGSTVSLGSAPSDTSEDWVVLVQRPKKVAYIHGDVGADGSVPSGGDPFHQMLLTDTGPRGASQFRDLIEAQGYSIEQLYDQATTLDAAFLSDFDVIVFSLHQKIWSEAETAALDTWLREGGGILVYSDSASGGNFSQVGIDNPVGQNVFNNLVSDYGLEVTVDQGGGTRAYVPDASASHPILLGQPELEGEGVSVVAVDPDSDAEVLIPFAPENRISGNGDFVPSDDGISISNPLWAALALAPVGEGNVVALFDRQPVWNSGIGSNINQRDNREILRRIVRFLAGDLGGFEDVPAAIETEDLRRAVTNTPYQFQLAGSGNPPLTWEATGLPEGFTLSSEGEITGTSETATTASVTVNLTDANNDTATAVFTFTVALPPGPGDTLLSEDFNGGNLDDWRVVEGVDDWSIQNDALASSTNVARTTLIYEGTDTSNWQNYELTVDFESDTSDDDMAGIIFYYRDLNNYLAYWASEGFHHEGGATPTRVLEQVVGGVRTVLASDSVAAIQGVAYTVTIRVENGGQVEVLQDDVPVFAVDTPAALTGGSVGFFTHWHESGIWDNLVVRLPEDELSAWLDGFELPADRRSPTDDPNHNGWPNLWQYLMNLHPGDANARSKLPRVSISQEAEESYFVITMRERVDATGLELDVEHSQNLFGWEPADEAGLNFTREVIDPDVDGDGSTALVEYKIPRAQGRVFLRFTLERK
ncbi:MAG: DUF4350 domain-containing protein [Opitutales bacterium]